MNLATTQDLFYLIGAISLVLITVFLCWALYEIARLGKQVNEVMQETRDKIGSSGTNGHDDWRQAFHDDALSRVLGGRRQAVARVHEEWEEKKRKQGEAGQDEAVGHTGRGIIHSCIKPQANPGVFILIRVA